MKNVIFFIGSLQAGGTEAKLARNFLPLLKGRGKMNPKLLLLKETGAFLEVLPEEIEKFSLREEAGTNIIRIIPRFRDALRRLNADVVISCMWYPAIVSFLARKLHFVHFRHVIHDTVNMTEYIEDHFETEKYRSLKTYLTKKAYRNAEAMIVVSQGEKKDLIDNFKMPEERIHVVYNPVNSEMISKMSSEEINLKINKPVIVTAGRLVYQKGFDILLRAFRKARNIIESKLLILGAGEKEKELMSLCTSLKLQEDVMFLGFQENPFKFMKEASVFCLASRYEGLGNVILEAMALGVPVIATDCRSGPGEILGEGKYGILVPVENPDAIAEAIIKVLSDSQLRERLADLSLKRAEDFSVEKALSLWEDIVLTG
jgi:glycosyltransferase involved in cell wall biosynthesis